MSKTYPDISHYEPVSDWAAVKKNCPFLITKATQGTSYVDSTLASFVKNCEKMKIPYWLYTYLNKGDELAQAKFLVSTCKGKVGDYFVGYVLDVEAGNAAAGVQKALDYLKTVGKKLMLYTMYAQYERYKSVIKARPDKCAWWEARYGLNNGAYNKNYPCHTGADLHQFTSNGRCPGIPGNVDLNRVTGQGKKESWFISPTTEKSVESTTTAAETGGNKYMFSVDTVKKGSTGNDVKLLQRLLKSNGCNNEDGSTLSIDGNAGSNTVYAIKTFQKKKDLTVDGVCGAKTWKKILLR